MQSGKRVRIFSTFVSMNGEVCQAHQGSICTFIRFAGCNLRCTWCDTKYAQKEDVGMLINTDMVMERVIDNGCRNVTITGGEPMMQKAALDELCIKLMESMYVVSVEINGSYDFDPIPGVDYVVDFKLPSSEEYMEMKVETPWMALRSNDWIKFVVKDNPDYEVACATMDMLNRKGCLAQYAMSPMHTDLDANKLLQWLKFDRRFDVVVSLQLHKLVDLNEAD